MHNGVNTNQTLSPLTGSLYIHVHSISPTTSPVLQSAEIDTFKRDIKNENVCPCILYICYMLDYTDVSKYRQNNQNKSKL